jgi:hypothetical protein
VTLVINYPAVAALLTNPVGPVGRKLEAIGDSVLQFTSTSLSVPWGGSKSRNPSPGPPRLRSGDLQRSLMRTNAMLVGGELQVMCAAPAVHRGRFYADILVSGEGTHLTGPYKFILDEELQLAVDS